MLTFLISILVSVGVRMALLQQGVGPTASMWWGIFSFVVALFTVGFIVRKRVTKVQKAMEETMLAGQKKINRKVQQFQSKPGGNLVAMQRQLEADQKAMLEEALAFTSKLEPFKKWNLGMGRQIATMRMQFHYQLKEWKEVDAILKTRGLLTGPMMTEPMSVAMKMAREYKNDDLAAVEKTFKWHSRWFRGDRGTLLYGLMSWIYVKQKESDKAREVLLKGKDKTANETLERNYMLLSNLKEKQFSNKGLGEEWYSLYLEKPPNPKQKRVRGNPKKHGMY